MSNVYESDFILPAMVFLIIQVFKTMTVPTISTLSLPIQSPSREGGRWETKHFIGMALWKSYKDSLLLKQLVRTTFLSALSKMVLVLLLILL